MSVRAREPATAALDDAVKEARTTVKSIKIALAGAWAVLLPTLSGLLAKLFGVF